MYAQLRSDPVRDDLMQALKTGKRWLREQKPALAYGEFQKAQSLAQELKDTAEEKKAARGLGNALSLVFVSIWNPIFLNYKDYRSGC